MSAGKSGAGSGGLGGTFEAAASGPMEEDAVRKALGLLPAGVVGEERWRHGARDLEDSGGGSGGGSGSLGNGGDVSTRFSQIQQAPGGAPLCLLLRNLGELFRRDAAAAADICADSFPGVRPW